MIEQIKQALLEKATQGKWEAKKGAGWFVKLGDTEKIAIVERPSVVGMKLEEADAHLIANAPEWLRYLLEHYEECRDDAITLHKQVKDLRKSLEIVYGIASEDFESFNQLELIRLTSCEALERTKP